MIEWKNAQPLPPRQYVCGHCGTKVASEKGLSGAAVDYYNFEKIEFPASLLLCVHCGMPTVFVAQDDPTEEPTQIPHPASVGVSKLSGPVDHSEPRFKITEGAQQVMWICHRFSRFATQLAKRCRDRDTLKIDDEYDVQDAMHALLRMHFDDVRPEEPTPSHAGASSRMDFLMNAERVVVETKHTRPDLLDGQIGKELILDIERYRSHPDCDYLVCYVHDPEHLLKNPVGLERDLSREDGRLTVVVIVGPRP